MSIAARGSSLVGNRRCLIDTPLLCHFTEEDRGLREIPAAVLNGLSTAILLMPCDALANEARPSVGCCSTRREQGASARAPRREPIQKKPPQCAPAKYAQTPREAAP